MNNEENEKRAVLPEGKGNEHAEFDFFDTEEQRLRERMRLARRACLVFAALLCAASVAFMLFWGNKGEQSEYPAESEQNPTSEWKGAFAEQSIYENCLRNVLSVRVEMGSGGDYWTGLVLSEDGWIATASKGLDIQKNGRLYVVFEDGERYAVESIYTDNGAGISLLKVNASGLNSVDIRQTAIQQGERVTALKASENNGILVASGELSGESGEQMRLNIPFEKSIMGAPVFDDDGLLLGMICASEDENKNFCLAYPAKMLESRMLSFLKE